MRCTSCDDYIDDGDVVLCTGCRATFCCSCAKLTRDDNCKLVAGQSLLCEECVMDLHEYPICNCKYTGELEFDLVVKKKGDYAIPMSFDITENPKYGQLHYKEIERDYQEGINLCGLIAKREKEGNPIKPGEAVYPGKTEDK